MSTLVPENDFYSQHGIWGAYASLVIGRPGRGAGVVIGDVKPPRTGLFAGYRSGGEEARLLPFTTGASFGLGAASYKEEGEAPKTKPGRGPAWFGAEEIERRLSFSGEEWRAGVFGMELISFFGEVPDPRSVSRSVARSSLLPAIYLRLRFDNTRGQGPMTGLFAMQGVGRPLSDSTEGGLLGMASGASWGFAVKKAAGVEEVMDWSAVEAAFDGDRALRRLANEGGLRFHVPAGAMVEQVLALGVFRSGVVSAGLSTQAYHACLFGDLEEVLECALDEAETRLAKAAELDALLEGSELDENRRFLLAHGTHSYCASAELLLAETGEPVFVENEGEYRMMNTLDLTVDHAFFEARFSPWTLRDVLDSFVERHSYVDAFGLAFANDQGVADCFAPRGSSVYEMPGLTDVFSFMTYEETTNWLISACLYASLAGDQAWARSRRPVIEAALRSIMARDANGDGVMDRDSDRCRGGSEITTYDSLDASLGQARNNLYLAVKAWSSLVCASTLLARLGAGASPGLEGGAPAETAATGAGPLEASLIEAAKTAAAKAASTIISKFLPDEGYIPAVFESDNRSRIIPAIEGLAYPRFCGAPEATEPEGPYGELVLALTRHLDTVLAPGICLDPESGGWKLSSTSRNTWLSKIFLNQFVAERVLGLEDERTKRDAVHARWLRSGSADYAATDQVDSATGADLGSRLYPRLVTAILWLEGGTGSGR